MGGGWLFKLKLADAGELDGADGRGAYDAFLKTARVSRRCAICRSTPTTAPQMLARDRRRRHRRPVRRHSRRQARSTGLLDLPHAPGRAGGRARARRAGGAQRRGGRGAVLPRRRRLSPSCAGERRPSDPALGIPDQLHALPAGDRAGHAAGPVRVPDPGRAADRHGGRQRLDVRRLDRLRRGDADGASRHAPAQGGAVGRPASALRRDVARPWRAWPATTIDAPAARSARRRRT